MDGSFSEPGTEPEVPAPGPGGRARWPLVLVVAVVVVLAGLGAFWLLGAGVRSTPPTRNGGGVANTTVAIGAVHLLGDRVNASVVCAACAFNVTAASEFNVSADLSRVCDVDGCSAEVSAAAIDPPFGLVATSPALPAAYPASGTVKLTLTLRAPATGGAFDVNGSVTGSSPPGPANVTAVGFSVTYSGLDAGYLRVGTPAVPLTEKPNTTFDLPLSLSSNSLYPEVVSSLSVGAPFVVEATSPALPLSLAAGGSVSVTLTVEAPPPGSYTLSGVVGAGPTPVVTPGNVSWRVDYFTDPFFSIAPAFGGVPAALHLGEVFTLDMWINNSDTQSHKYEVHAVSAPWQIVSVGPSGNVTVAAGAHQEWILSLAAPLTTGTFDIIVTVYAWT